MLQKLIVYRPPSFVPGPRLVAEKLWDSWAWISRIEAPGKFGFSIKAGEHLEADAILTRIVLKESKVREKTTIFIF
jgi:hypothetical protein